MAESLIIVDSPVKKTFFEEYYTGDAELHIATVPVVQPSHKANGYGKGAVEFTFSVVESGKETAEKLQAYQNKNIILALDSDPRSEYLSWLISSYVKKISKGKNTVKRLNLSGVNDEEVKEAFDFVSVVDDQRGVNYYIRSLFDAFLARHLIRLIGTSRGPGNFPLQFNSLSTIFLLADREMEIQMFSPTLKWQVRAELSLSGHFFDARLEEVHNMTTDGFLKEQRQAKRVLELIEDDPFEIESIDRTPLDIQPPSPYMLPELLHDCLVLHGIGPKDVLGCLRKLFHGVEVDGKVLGLISSFSTLENANTSGWLLKLKEEVVAQCGPEALGKGVVEPVTGMIFPLMPRVTAEKLSSVLSEEEAKIYELIRCRALASQMKAAVGENLKVDISAGPEAYFRTQFHTVSEKGFLAVYRGRNEKSLLVESPFADIEEGQVLNLIKLIPEQTGGMPAEHYTIETLFTDLADFSITADPVNVFMIQGMINAGYIITTEDGYLKLGENVKKVTSILNKAFPHMQGINLSAYIEQTIAEATSGRKDLDFALKQFDQAMILQGRPLVKAKIPKMIKPRVRRSSTIIKQPSEEQVEPVVQEEKATSVETPAQIETEKVEQVATEKEAAVPTEAVEPEEAVVAEQVPDAAVEQPVEEVKDQESVEADASVAAELEAEVEVEEGEEAGPEEDAEEVVAETMEETAFLAEDKDEWPDELKKAFETALLESDKKDAEPQATSPDSPLPEAVAEKVIETDQEHICQVCGKMMILKEDRFGKFWACSGFPGCRHTETFSKDDQSLYCPICHESKIYSKRTPSGKAFYVCMDQECEFMSWSKPHYLDCQLCDSPYLVEKKSSSGRIQLRCPKAGCDYSRPLGGDGAIVEEEPARPAKRKVRVRRKPGSAPIGSGSGKKKVRIVRRKKK